MKCQVTRKRETIVLIFRKDRKKDPGNDQPVSLTSVSGKVMEEIILEAVLKAQGGDSRQSAWLLQGQR